MLLESAFDGMLQLGRIYLDMLNVYKVLSENISTAVALNGMCVCVCVCVCVFCMCVLCVVCVCAPYSCTWSFPLCRRTCN